MDLKNKENTALSLLEEHIRRGKSIELVSNYSMHPFLLKGDRIIARRTSADELVPGDLVICRSDAYFYIHRFLYKRMVKIDAKQNSNHPYLLITKGDNVLDPDPPLPEGRLIGKAMAIKRANIEIRIEGALWKTINYILAMISLWQFYSLKFLRFIKNSVCKNRVMPGAVLGKKILRLPLRSAILFSRLFMFKKIGEADLSTEERLAALCARVRINDRMRLQIKELLEQSIDWEQLNKLLAYHHVTALAYYNIKKINREAIPVEFPVKEKIDECIAKNLLLSRELKNILSSFREAGFNAIPMKGIYLLGTLYADLPLREMHDLDILIREKDLSTADRCVRESGYQPEDQTFDWRDLSAPKYYRKFFYHLKYKKASPHLSIPIFLEIHFDILPPFRGRNAFLSDIWKDVQDVNSSGVSFPAMSTEDLLIYLSLKLFASFEFFIILKDLCDIAELIKRHDRQIDWNIIIEKAKSYNASSMVYYSLRLTQDLLMDGNNLIPKNVIGELKPFFLKRIFLDRIIRWDRLSEAADNRILMIAFMREYLFDIMSIRGIPDMWRLIRNVLYNYGFYERLLRMPKYRRGFLYLIRFLEESVLLINLAIRSLRRNSQ